VKYVAVLEPARDGGWGAYVPDLPGCVAVAETKEETERLIRDAIPLHIESLREEGESIPEPGSNTRVIEF
jgi:predicted RNase H-like HicB family nuclease